TDFAHKQRPGGAWYERGAVRDARAHGCARASLQGCIHGGPGKPARSTAWAGQLAAPTFNAALLQPHVEE
ncbi:MAG TPA: hypothetical protein VJA26_12795, partial [Gammaproteobacteria bacterium]|nr:hypothetical protein [Gammaproteobacteria bacterium]